MFSTFTAIFEALDNLETELQKGVDDKEKSRIEETLISLRNTMDKCVHYWIQFEERVASLQEKHQLELPDNLPESFLDNITCFEETGENTENSSEKQNEPCQASAGDKSKLTPSSFPPLQDHSVASDPDKIKQYEASLKESFTRLSDENAVISFRKGMGFWDLAMIEEALKEFEKVTHTEPNFITGHFFLGLASSYQGDHEKACKELKLVIALDSDKLLKALAHNTLGSIYAEEGKLEAALENFQKAVELKEDLKEAYFNLGAVQYRQNKYRSAFNEFNKYLKYDPEDWEALLYAGKASGHMQDWEKALEFLEKAYQLNPREPRTTFEMGVIYRLLENNHKAAFYLHTTKRLVHRQKEET